MIYTEKSQLHGKNISDEIFNIRDELFARNILVKRDYDRIKKTSSSREVFEILPNAYTRIEQTVRVFPFTPFGLDSLDCKEYADIQQYSVDCGVSMPYDFRNEKIYDLLWKYHQVLARTRYKRNRKLDSIKCWEVINERDSPVPTPEQQKAFCQAHWLEEFDGWHVGIHWSTKFRVMDYYAFRLGMIKNVWIPYKALSDRPARLYFGYGDVAGTMPSTTKIYGDKEILLSRYPKGVIDVATASNGSYESGVLFPSFVEGEFSVLPCWVCDGAKEIVANGGTVPGYTP